jgi:two-component sensor histidine kinase
MLMWVFVGAAGRGTPVHERPVWSAVAVLAVAACLVTAGMILARVGFQRAATLRDANAQLLAEIAHREVLESEQRLLVRELDHRVRNTLAQVLSLAESTAQGTGNLEQFNTAFGQRIRALSRAHGVLTNSRWADTDLKTFLSAVLEPFVSGPDPSIVLEGETVMIPARASTPLCMVYYELAANAARHGALSVPGGRVELTWRKLSNGHECVEIRWKERDGPPVRSALREGFGIALIRTIIPHELGGRTDLRFEPDGVECIVAFELEAPSSPLAQKIPASAKLAV